MKVQSKHPSPYHHNSDEPQKVCEFVIPHDYMPWEKHAADFCMEPAAIVQTTRSERSMGDGYNVHRSYYCEPHARSVVERLRKQGDFWSNDWSKLGATQ